jgi:dolichyl-phosphate beta-glucosyltransferase
MLPPDHELTLIIPAFNEEQRLPATLAQLASFLDGWGIDYRVLVVDDGSSDGTAVLTDHWGPRFSILRLAHNGGKGRAVRIAMLSATGRVLAFTDADLPFELAALRRGYQRIRGGQCQVVFGARDMEGSDQRVRCRLSRRIATRMFRAVVKRVVPCGVTDTQCGLKLFSRRASREIFSRATIDGFAFDTEVVMLTQRLGLPWERIPVVLINDYASTLSLRRNALPMLLDVLGLWLRSRLKRPLPEPSFPWAEETIASEEDRREAA